VRAKKHKDFNELSDNLITESSAPVIQVENFQYKYNKQRDWNLKKAK